MTLTLHSTLIKEDGAGNATVELMISEGEDATTSHVQHISTPDHEQFRSRGETVFLRIVVPANHNYLSGYQGDAIKRAIAILEDGMSKLKKG